MSLQTQPIFLVEALKMAERGIPVSFLPAGEKGSRTTNWQNTCTTATDDLVRQAANSDRLNYSCVAKATDGGFLFLDDDGGIRQEYEKVHGAMPPTLKVQSCNGSYHYYFHHSAASLAYQSSIGKAYIGEPKPDGGELWSLRMHNSYVVGPGSVAPNHEGIDSEYRLAWDAPVIEIPDTLLQFLISRYESKDCKNGEKKPLDLYAPITTGSRNTELTRRAGKLHRAGLSEESILRELIVINDECCDTPLDLSEIETIAHSIGSKPPDEEYEDVSNVSMGGIWINGPDRGKSVPGYVPKTRAFDVSTWQDNFKTVNELEQGEIRMLINGFLPEGTTFIGALPGEGKTLLALSIVKALTTGKSFLGRSDFSTSDVVPVIYMIPESSARAFRQRCDKFQIPSDRSLFLCRTISEGTTLRLDDPLLLEAVRIMKPVVILDTVIRFSESDDENAAMQNKQIADDIIRLRQAGAVGVIGIHHATKAMREKGMTLETVLRGTGDLAACADAVYGMLRDAILYNHGLGPNEINVECVKPRDFDPPLPFRIAATRKIDADLIGTSRGIASVIDADGDFQIVQSAALQINRDAQLVELITEDPTITLPELEKATGMSQWIIRKALRRLGWTKPKGGKKGTHQWVTAGPTLGSDADVTFDSQ